MPNILNHDQLHFRNAAPLYQVPPNTHILVTEPSEERFRIVKKQTPYDSIRLSLMTGISSEEVEKEIVYEAMQLTKPLANVNTFREANRLFLEYGMPKLLIANFKELPAGKFFPCLVIQKILRPNFPSMLLGVFDDPGYLVQYDGEEGYTAVICNLPFRNAQARRDEIYVPPRSVGAIAFPNAFRRIMISI